MQSQRQIMMTTGWFIVLGLMLSTVSAFAQKTTVTMGTWVFQDTWQLYDPQFNAMQEHLPHIELDASRIADHQDYAAKILLLAATGDLPDILQVPPEQVAPLVEAGILVDLESFMESDPEFDRSMWLPPVVEAVQYNGITFGMPGYVVNYTYGYNEEILSQRGVVPPDPNEWIHWDTIREIARKATYDQSGDGAIDVWGYYHGFSYDMLLPLIFQNGGQVYNADQEIQLDTSEAREALTWLVSMIRQEETHPPTSVARSAFNQGGVATIRMNSPQMNQIGSIISQVGNSAGAQNVQKSEVAYVTTFAMTRNARRPEETWEVLKWLTSADGQWYVAERGRVPIRRDIHMQELTDHNVARLLEGFIHSLGGARSYPYHIASDIITQTFSVDIYPVLRGEQPIENFTADFDAKINAMIRQERAR